MKQITQFLLVFLFFIEQTISAEVRVMFDHASPTKGIQEALNRASSEGGGMVFIPKGNYVIAWNWKGREGEKIKVFTYTNLEEVELFQDGKSLGKQKAMPFENQSWEVSYKPGILVARGYKNGKFILSDQVVSAGDPYSVKVSGYKNSLKADGEDALTLKFEILDKKGIVCPHADNIIQISIEGSGHLLGVDNGNPANINPAKLPEVRAFNGLCSAIVQAGEETGGIIITATSKGLQSGTLEIKTSPVEMKPAVKSDLAVKDFIFFRKPEGWIIK